MIQQALDWMFQQGLQRAKSEIINARPDAADYLITHGDGHTEVVSYAKPVEYLHSFRTVEGLVGYLNSRHCGGVENGIVFVGRKKVYANIAYHSNQSQGAFMLLDFAEGFLGLRRLFDGVGPKDLWRLLVTQMWGTIDPALGADVRAIRIDSGSSNEIEIDDLGIVARDGNQRTLNISYPDGKELKNKQIRTEYQYEGRIFECMPNVYCITLRVEVLVSNGSLIFKFHPRQFESVMTQARQDIVNALSDGQFDGIGQPTCAPLDPSRWTVHEGVYGAKGAHINNKNSGGERFAPSDADEECDIPF